MAKTKTKTSHFGVEVTRDGAAWLWDVNGVQWQWRPETDEGTNLLRLGADEWQATVQVKDLSDGVLYSIGFAAGWQARGQADG